MREEKIRRMEQGRRLCGFWLLRQVAEKMTAACRQGGGAVRSLEEMGEEDFTWAMGLYEVLLDAAEGYIGCSEGMRAEVCTVRCRECLDTERGESELPCSGKDGCTRF